MLAQDKSQLKTQLRSVFRLDDFHDNQWVVIEKLLHGHKVLLVEKTGFGKSLCYQFPALLFGGTTIVFSPLLALMRDQVNHLQKLGVAAGCINSEQSPEQNQEMLERAKQNEVKILYIAPERLENSDWIKAVGELDISMVVVDEAHCISVWGHDFRPAYRRIVDLIKMLPATLPVLATTATATRRVQRDIIHQIGGHIDCVRGQLLRENFELYVIRVNSEDEKMVWIGRHLNQFKGSGLIYCGTQVATEIYSKWLEHLGVNSVMYNAGLEAHTRKEIEEGLITNRYKCVVSTNALGMGLDKPDLRFIIHTQIPVSPIHYYQEIGRAGRDGQKALLVLFYNPHSDMNLPQAFIEGSKPSIDKYNLIINLLREEGLSEIQLVKKSNLKQNQVRTIKDDLISRGIVHQVRNGTSKYYEYTYGAPQFDEEPLKQFRNAKYEELRQMVNYVNTSQCRMKFLCEYLGDTNIANCGHCDNDIGRTIQVTTSSQWLHKLDKFKKTALAPPLRFSYSSLAMQDGIAASYYGFSDIGKIIHSCKYGSGGPFPDELLEITLCAYQKHLASTPYDLVLYVPSTESGDLVAQFSRKFALRIDVPLSDNLYKTRDTQPQRLLGNGYLKHDNVKGAFAYHDPAELSDKTILLVDDVCDSGHTIKEIGRYLSRHNVAAITPLVIAQIVNSDIKQA